VGTGRDRREILTIARQTALRIAREHPEVLKIILFGSFARGDYGARSDLDLLVVLAHSDQSPQQRYTDFLRCVSNYPTDLLVLTQADLASRQADDDLFLRRALREGILFYPESDHPESRGERGHPFCFAPLMGVHIFVRSNPRFFRKENRPWIYQARMLLRSQT